MAALHWYAVFKRSPDWSNPVGCNFDLCEGRGLLEFSCLLRVFTPMILTNQEVGRSGRLKLSPSIAIR